MRSLWRTWFDREPSPRRALTTAALTCVSHGWPVIPGAWWSQRAGRHACDIPGCLTAGPHPAGGQRGLTDRTSVKEAWDQHPYNVLVATGGTCDAIEARGVNATALSAVIRAGAGPIVAAAGCHYYFVRPTSTQHVRTATQTRLLIHRSGSWVPIPPSIIDGEPVTWIVKPSTVRWRLPDAAAIIAALSS